MKVLSFLMAMEMIDLDVDWDEECEGEGDENNPKNAEIEPSENIENDIVNTKEPTDLVLLRKIWYR